jgi:hypothetical protein
MTDWSTFEAELHDAPRVREERPAVRRIDAVLSLACVVAAFLGANWIVQTVGGQGSVLVVFWATALLFGFLLCVGASRILKRMVDWL